MKRIPRIAAVAAGTAAALVLAGCAGTPDSAAGGSGGDQVLTVTTWDKAETPEFQAVFDAFEKANPGVTVKAVDVPTAANYEDKITAMLAGGDDTDIITVKNTTDYSGYVKKGQLVNLNDEVGTLPKDQLAGLDQYKVKGGYFAIPYRTDFNVLYYDKKAFADAGLADPANLTWDQFADDAIKLTKGSGSSKRYGAYIHTWNSLVQGFAAVQSGNTLADTDYSFMKSQYDMTLKLQKAGAIMDYATAKSQQVAYQDMFETQKAAMVPMGTWLIAVLLKDKAAGKTSVDWGIAPLPQPEAGTPIVTDGGPTGFSISKKAAHPDLAKKFVEFAASEAGAKAVASIGIVPSLQSDALTKAYFGLAGMPQDGISKKAFSPDTVKPDAPSTVDMSQINTILDQEHQLIMTGSKSVDAGIKEMESRVASEVQQ